MLAALSWKAFELDRYFIAKELVLNAAAFPLAILLLLPRRTNFRVDIADALLIVFIVWSALSALLATNYWLAQRALGVSLASALIFWSARRAASGGMSRLLLAGAALAGVAVAVTSLAQAYGAESDYFTLARAPGGTLGNRNFIAHIAAIALPATLWGTMTARRSIWALAGSVGVGLLAAVLVLSRSRAAWLAVAACTVVIAIPLVVSRRHWNRRVGGRLARILLAAVIGGFLAVALPNDLDWKSDSPYLDSARNMVDYSKGSGRGRMAQYRNSLRMLQADPVLGVGPGNWPVRYVRFAPAGDRSLADNGMTANPWPSSDWMAFVSERGFVAAVALLGVFVTLFVGALRGWRDLPDGEAVLMKVSLAGTVVSTIVVSSLDAVLLLPASAFLVWLLLGAMAGERRRGMGVMISRRTWSVLAAGVVLLSGISLTRSVLQTMAMSSVGAGGHRAGWVAGATLDPGSYRINQRVAELYANRGQCSRARPYARRALSLFPYSAPAKRVARRCGIPS
ncbi:MAG: O-antigen ligase family protein [Gemmatimonadales bacterium]